MYTDPNARPHPIAEMGCETHLRLAVAEDATAVFFRCNYGLLFDGRIVERRTSNSQEKAVIIYALRDGIIYIRTRPSRQVNGCHIAAP